MASPTPIALQAAAGMIAPLELDEAGIRRAAVAAAGEIIIVQERHDSLRYVQLQVAGELKNRHGLFLHDDLLGSPLGRRWYASDPATRADLDDANKKSSRKRRRKQLTAEAVKGPSAPRKFVYAFAATPELWTLGLTHRTQVLYVNDIALIITMLNIKPGSVVVEAGTGSGSMTCALARVVAGHEDGAVHSFDFHIGRVEAARVEFAGLGMFPPRVNVEHRDIVRAGFPGHDGSTDAIFLDLPAPYLCIAASQRVLRGGGRLAVFSPCIEQVQRSCEELRQAQFHSLSTVTCVLRTYEIRRVARQSSDTETAHGGFKLPRPLPGESLAKPAREMKSHTSYLTFATRNLDGYPPPARDVHEPTSSI